MAAPTSWEEGRNSIVTTVSRKTAHRRISFLIVAVSAPERHWIGFQSHFASAAHATYIVGTVRSSGHTRLSGRTLSSGRTHIYRYIQARAWQYKFHHLTYLREARFARQLQQLAPEAILSVQLLIPQLYNYRIIVQLLEVTLIDFCIALIIYVGLFSK